MSNKKLTGQKLADLKGHFKVFKEKMGNVHQQQLKIKKNIAERKDQDSLDGVRKKLQS